MRLLIGVLFVFLLIPNRAHSWGPEGHKIICFIADTLLTSEKKKRLYALVDRFEFRGHTYKFYSSSCNFGDVARARAQDYKKAKDDGNTHDASELEPWARFLKFNKWHFLNLKRTDRTVDMGDCPSSTGCVLKAIEFHKDILKTGSEQECAVAVVMLGHWIGDIHQPLHVSFKDDAGGNRINDVDGIYGEDQNLHRIWDSGIIRIARKKKNKNWLGYGRVLAVLAQGRRSEWGGGSPILWAQQSYDMARHRDTKYCLLTSEACKTLGKSRDLYAEYQNINQPKIEMRLMQAGIRLAEILDEAL